MGSGDWSTGHLLGNFITITISSESANWAPQGIYHIFAYLKRHQDISRIVYDPKMPKIDESAFNQDADWSDFYGDVHEELPANMPEPRGNAVTISAFVDADHAGNVVTRRSHTGIVIFVQNAPIMVYSKRQNTVEAATFGSEFVALRVCKDLIVALRYKLRVFGVPIDGPANVFCDNRGVVKNVSVPESVLMKKHNAINYHAVREAAAAKILRGWKGRWNDKYCRPVYQGFDRAKAMGSLLAVDLEMLITALDVWLDQVSR
jgi:hypothetical protein